MTPAQQPVASVIIPFLNGANFIREAVDSVFGQSFESWELILVDDGSSDESSQFAAELAETDPRVSYMTHPGHANRGPALSRALGSSAARGDYLLFLDHDDVLYPGALLKMARELNSHPGASAVFAGVHFWAFDPSLQAIDWVSSYGRIGSGLVSGRRMLRDLIRSDAHHPAICSTLFRRHAYDAVRDASAAYPGIYEDTAVLFQLLVRAVVYVLDEPVADYRMHAASRCHRAKAEGKLSDEGFSEDRYRFLSWAAENVPMDALSRGLLRAVLGFYWFQSTIRRR
jgi:glycosyltransferase involved in cell wall biosynthesis